MSSAVETDTRRAQQVTSARKKVGLNLAVVADRKLKQFRATRSSHHSPTTSRTSSASSSSATVLSNSTADNTFPRRAPSHTKAVLEAVADDDDETPSHETTPALFHARHNSRHQRQKSSISMSWPRQRTGSSSSTTPRPTVVGLFDVPPLDQLDEIAKLSDADHSDNSLLQPHEVVTTPATTPVDRSRKDATDEPDESAVRERLTAFSFGAKPGPSKQSPGLLPSFAIQETSPRRDRHVLSKSPVFDFSAAFPSSDDPSRSRSRPTSPQAPSRRRHSHNRSESISLPNLKLGRPPSGLPSPFASVPSSPMGDAPSRSRLSTPQSGSRLKFEPSDKEKEESRRRALDKLTGGVHPVREEPKLAEISLPVFDDDDDLVSTSSSRPPSDALNSTASSSRPSSFTFGSTSSFNSSTTSPLPWSQFDEQHERWSFGQRFDPKEDAPFVFETMGPTKTSSVLLTSSNLGVLTEEDETEDDADDEETDVRSASSIADSNAESNAETAPAGPTPSRLRELHLVSSVSSQGSRRSSNPEALQSFSRAMANARDSPSKGYGNIGRGRPRPLALDSATASAFKSGNTTSPSKAGAAPVGSLMLQRGPSTSRRSSISYKKDDSGSGSSRDYASSRDPMSPPMVPGEITSPTMATSPLSEWAPLARSSARPCPRPRSAIIGGMSGRVLNEVGEEEEEGPKPGGYESRDESRHSFDGAVWPLTGRRSSHERFDVELERDALREDVELWRKRCRGLEERLESERREANILRERVRKLGDRLLTVSATASAPTPDEEREAAQTRLITEMRDQLFSIASALERERKEKNEALLHIAELQAAYEAAAPDGAHTPHVLPNSLPTTPKSRPNPSSTAHLMATPPEAQYADADYLDVEVEAGEAPSDPDDPNWRRMRGFAFPHGPVEKGERENKRESFFGLSRPRAVRAAPSIGGPGGLAWATAMSPTESGFDLPPFEVHEGNRDVVRPASLILKANAGAHAQRERERFRDSLMRSSGAENHHSTPERQQAPTTASAGGFGFSFFSGYLNSRSTPQAIPRVMVTPSSVSPKKPMRQAPVAAPSPRHVEREHQTHYVARSMSDLDFRDSCASCIGGVIEL